MQVPHHNQSQREIYQYSPFTTLVKHAEHHISIKRNKDGPTCSFFSGTMRALLLTDNVYINAEITWRFRIP
jgi:hypothetical protein